MRHVTRAKAFLLFASFTLLQPNVMAEEYATIDLSLAQRNYHVPSQFGFTVDDGEVVVISTDLRYTHNGLGDPAQFNQNTFGLLVTGGNGWWQGPNEVLTPINRGNAIGNRLPGPTALHSGQGELGWVENWLPHSQIGLNPAANLDPDTLEPLPVEERVDQVSPWLRLEWVLEGYGDAVEGYGVLCRLTDDEGFDFLDGEACYELDEGDEARLMQTTPYELNSSNERDGFAGDLELFAGYTTGWNPDLDGDGSVAKDVATNFTRVDVDNFSVSRDSDVMFADDFSSYPPGEPIGGGVDADPPHNWNPKWAVSDPDGEPDTGDEDNSQQLLFVRDGIPIEPSCTIPDGGLMGDLDGNGSVEFADFLTLSTNFGTDVLSYEEGDLNCDGSVAFDDFLAFSANFGQTVEAAASVPEPTSISLLAFCCFGLILRRRRR